MKKIYLNKIMLVLVSAGLGLASFAHALNNPDSGLFVTFSDNSVAGIITQIIKILLGIVGLLSMVFIIIGGFQYITSSGNDELAAAGKKTLTNAIVGLIIVIVSYSLVVVVANALTS